MNTPYSYIRSLALTLLSVLLLTACVADRCRQPNKPQEPGNSASEQPLPKGYKPITIELELNTRMSDSTPLRNAVSCDEDPEYLREHPEQSLRAIDLETTADAGSKFKFAAKSGDNMIVILSQKDAQGNPINTIYLDHVRYKGNGDNTFQIPRQRLSGIAQQSSTEKLEPGSKDWYAMCIYDNPKHPFFRRDNQGITMVAATWDERGGYEAPISFSTLRSSGSTSVSDIEIPFFSEWTPVQISDDLVVENTSSNPIRLKMPGVLLRVEVYNESSLPILMKGLKVETNVIHANVKYDLAPDKLPRIGQGSVLSSLSWSPMTPSHVSNTDPTLESLFMMTEDLVMMGPSLVTYRNYEKPLAGHPNLEQEDNRKMKAPNGRLPQDLYLWGMPITDQETTRFNGKEQIPMTAVYTSYTSQERSGYVRSDDKDFDNKILLGDKPAPGGSSQLSFVSATKLRDPHGKPLTGIVPLQVFIQDRDPSPLDYMCNTTPILQPKDTPQEKPTFKRYEFPVKTSNDPCYFSFDYVTNQQPDGSFQNDRLRLRYKKDAAPIAGYHIPSQEEMNAVLCSRIIVFGNPSKANTYPNYDKIEYTTDISNPRWQKQQLQVKDKSYRCLGLFRKTSPGETAILTNTQVGEVRAMYVGLRGLKDPEPNEDLETFHYSPAMGLYLYSAGDNKFYLECIPLSRHWVKRFNNQRIKFVNYVMSGHFFYFFKDNRIKREIPYAVNWGNPLLVPPYEKWGSFYWLSPPKDKEYYHKNSPAFLCFGFEWDDIAHGGNLIFHPFYENGARNPTGKNPKAKLNGFPVILFYDKLWEH